ncbi:hypothetical protein LCGC14_2210840 [marine sediment metagenome]|uniref:Uncharacterized protein n=1 Tax=marine sediment metagenome TaxID=412755 RepID=A0A0F9DE10_9ZZZZ
MKRVVNPIKEMERLARREKPKPTVYFFGAKGLKLFNDAWKEEMKRRNLIIKP